MNWVSIGIGVFALCYGFYTIYARLKFPSKFGKLEAMKQMYGERLGIAIHTLSYTVVPIIFGITMILGGLRGAPLFGR